MKIPPLIINLKVIEKQDKQEKNDKHEKHKEHKKHKKHKKHKHKHHHHDHEHGHKEHREHKKHRDHNEPREHKDKHPIIKIINPPVLEPVGLPEPEVYPYQSAYAPPSPVPYPNVLHPVPTPPSQLLQEAAAKSASPAQNTDLEPNPPADAVTTLPSPSTPAETTLEQKQDTQPVEQPTDQVVEHAQPADDAKLAELSHLEPTEDGGVRLRIIVPTRQSDDSDGKILNLEQVCGQLQDGLDVIPSDVNEEECKEQLQVNPVDYVEPPTFGSYLPIKDSTFANLTKEDSETLLEIYGGNSISFEYAESLQNYAKGTTYLMKMVDSLLDLLTEGRHNKEAVPIRQKLNEQAQQKTVETEDVPMIVESGNQEPDQMNVTAGADDEVQKQLNEIDTLLEELRKVQEKRLSSSPAPVEPDETETKLADEVLEKMTKLIKEKAKPSEICESSSILKALGIPLDV